MYDKANTTNMITIESGVKHLSQTYLGIVYLDPTNLNKKCSEADAKANRNQDGTITGVKSGCMKWYIYDENSTSYTAILDHNTTVRVQYNSDNVNTSQKEVAITLTNDTAGWGTKGEEVIDLNPRLITADEVAKITGVSWNSSSAIESNWFYFDSKNQTRTNMSQGASNYAWLFDNLGWYYEPCTNYGCNINDTTISAGYWTNTPVAESDSSAWNVIRYGILYFVGSNEAGYGLRPVITISKSLFNS